MSCGHCGTSKNGALPTGCKDHGSCKSGGCNRLNVHNWLSLIPLSEFDKPYPFVEVSFNHGSRKEFFKYHMAHTLEKGDYVAVEAQGGFDVGVVSITGELVKLQMKKKGISSKSDEIRKILHKATESELEKLNDNKKKEREMMIRARVISRDLKLNMKIAEVEVQADGKKATFFYTADDRVDFRELIKLFAVDFKVKVEMRQIGIRQEAAKVGGIGSCGRELCCSTWLNEYKTVSTTAARYQNLSINQTKLSGQCGRLKCCLNYELDTYMDALRVFPDNAERIKLKAGTAYLQKKDIFKNLMWYSFEKSNTLYPLRIERVNQIMEDNKKGIFPEELLAEEVNKKASTEDKTDFVDVVGQFSLRSLERASKKKKQKAKLENERQPNTTGGGGNNGPRPNNNQPRPNPNQGNRPAQGAPQGGNVKPGGQNPNPKPGNNNPNPNNPNPNNPNPNNPNRNKPPYKKPFNKPKKEEGQ
jgi:cell fate regulator YaaT (PSP1 superfamily)